MLHHLSFGVLDLQRAGRFYDAVLSPLGYVRVFEDDTALGYGYPGGDDKLSLKLVPRVAIPGEGVHLAFAADSRARIDAFHAAALRHGGRCNGAPGLRPDYGDHYYAAFVVDPDGYRLEAVMNAPDHTGSGTAWSESSERVPRGSGRVTLEPVTIDNVDTLIEMQLPPEQDRWLANNAASIAQAGFYPDWRMRAICCDGEPAGFLLYDVAANDEAGHYGIYRFMVEHARQGRGIGRDAMALLLAELRAQPNANRITICYKPENVLARRLYRSCGFTEVGVDETGEMIAEIRLGQAGDAVA